MQTFATYAEALAATPVSAKWSSSFGYPGEAGYTEYLITQDDKRLVIKNGDWDAIRPFTWTLEQSGEYPAGTYKRR